MLQHENKYSENEVRDLVFLALIHDIGAYKTEEIDNMFLFEEVRPNDHAVYGYLFIKHFILYLSLSVFYSITLMMINLICLTIS